MNPLVSVLMPSYNRSEFIARSIESVLAQTFADWELIVLDDGSTDDTEDVVARFRDPRIIYAKNARNLGISESRNTCVSMARGKYFAWLDSDDLAVPRRLEIQVSFLEVHPDTLLCCGRYNVIDRRGKVIERPSSGQGDLPVAWSLLWGNPIAQSSVMARRDPYVASGIHYDPNLKVAEDYDVWCRLAGVSGLRKLDDVLLRYRRSGDSAFHSDIAGAARVAISINERYLHSLLGLHSPMHASLTDYAWAAPDPYRPKNLSEIADWYDGAASGVVRRLGLSIEDRRAIDRDIRNRVMKHVERDWSLLPGHGQLAGMEEYLSKRDAARLRLIKIRREARASVRQAAKRVLGLVVRA